ncbi:MAG: precorrin-2 C(20)-methyltransferase [Lachnospiraceae bacterium]|nr:precorrin-2 C(20)-methyltransferase [Lachnospiraceae bacterium]
MTGTLFAVGVGPGDPELITIKAVNVLKKADIIACPVRGTDPGYAYQIASVAVPELTAKEKLLLDFPMGEGDQSTAHNEGAKRIIAALESGNDVAFVTLGDPCFYSSFGYISKIIRDSGFNVEIVSGIPSFCAVPAKLKLMMAQGKESVMITAGDYRDFDGTLIILKAGRNLTGLKEKIKEKGKSAYLVENCGMPDEKVYRGIQSIPDEAGYFSILIVQ